MTLPAGEGYRIRPIEPADDAAVAALIRRVMPEFGASGPGFAILDPEVDRMCATYRAARSAYFVIEGGGSIAGGGGVAPLQGAAPDICELRKMYFLPELRGLGLGQRLLAQCLETARRFGFHRCYLETLTGMDRAQALYERNGFRQLDRPLGATGHFGCNRWYLKELVEMP
jgi:putative acetyltransferase